MSGQHMDSCFAVLLVPVRIQGVCMLDSIRTAQWQEQRSSDREETR